MSYPKLLKLNSRKYGRNYHHDAMTLGRHQSRIANDVPESRMIRLITRKGEIGQVWLGYFDESFYDEKDWWGGM